MEESSTRGMGNLTTFCKACKGSYEGHFSSINHSVYIITGWRASEDEYYGDERETEGILWRRVLGAVMTFSDVFKERKTGDCAGFGTSESVIISLAAKNEPAWSTTF